MMRDDEIISYNLGKLAAYQVSLPLIIQSIKEKGFLASSPLDKLEQPDPLILKNSTGREMDVNSRLFKEGFENGVSEMTNTLVNLGVITRE